MRAAVSVKTKGDAMTYTLLTDDRRSSLIILKIGRQPGGNWHRASRLKRLLLPAIREAACSSIWKLKGL